MDFGQNQPTTGKKLQVLTFVDTSFDVVSGDANAADALKAPILTAAQYN
ncbi:hypothetical protein [Pseudorhodobacter turbinis]|nr:hypothetical protein [Pseudorhodobacter turbinis]